MISIPRASAFFIVGLVMGCNSGGSEADSDSVDVSPIVGAWSLSNGACFRVLSFGESGEYSSAAICQTSANTANGQSWTGSYVIDGVDIETVTDADKCGEGYSTVGQWSVSGETLTLDTGSTRLIYQSLADDKADADFSGTLTKGCFGDSGFVPF